MLKSFLALDTRGFSRSRREFSVLAEGRHIFGTGHCKDLAETGNHAKKSMAPRVVFSGNCETIVGVKNGQF